jgi:predicted PurR-regulated permease PerM
MSQSIQVEPKRAPLASEPQAENAVAYPPLIAIVSTIAALYFGRAIFMPLATAVLLTFALSPLVGVLRKIQVPRPVAIVTVVLGAFAAIVMFGMIVAGQLGSLANNLPLYQTNIETKMQSLKDANFGEGIYSRVSKLLERLGRQIQEDQVTPPPGDVAAAPEEPAAPPPLPVQVVDPEPQPLQVLKTIIGPLIEPLATGGIVIVVVIFMLLKREDLRDRFIRLVGASDIHRTTEALEDAGRRVGQYLLMQLVVNVTYAIPIGLGLWIIGVPNAPLWALMALVLRFVPFIGPVISSIFPLALAVAVDPGWSMLLWTVALFAVVELVSNNIIEPWLYGSRTGLSPLAIILAAVLWTWLWGPIGLLLSTPLTVCLVVLGRHVPRFEFLDVMFGNKPVLQPHQQLYQRLLAGDPDEATERAEEFLQENDLLTFYDTVAIPALAVGELDRARGVMSEDRRKRVAESCLALVDNLEEYVEDSEATAPKGDDAAEDGSSAAPKLAELPDGSGKLILCAGGRGELDNAAMAMLAQLLASRGASARAIDHSALEPSGIKRLDVSDADAVVIGYLSARSVTHARYIVRRLKRVRSSLCVGVVLWAPADDPLSDLKLTAAIGCDFISRSMRDAVVASLASAPAAAKPAAASKVAGRKSRAPRVATSAAT